MSDVNPFSTEFLTDPYPYHDQLRESDPSNILREMYQAGELQKLLEPVVAKQPA